jgi:hypothetical protein
MALAILSQLPSISYPSVPQHGRWLPVTSTIDWCEEVSEQHDGLRTGIDCFPELCRDAIFGGNSQHPHEFAVHVPRCERNTELSGTWTRHCVSGGLHWLSTRWKWKLSVSCNFEMCV